MYNGINESRKKARIVDIRNANSVIIWKLQVLNNIGSGMSTGQGFALTTTAHPSLVKSLKRTAH